jgi:hypothetical protein
MDDVKTAGSRYCGISSDRACGWAERHPVQRWPELAQEAVERNVGTWDCDANGKATNGRTIRAKVRKRSPGAEQPVIARKSPTKGWSAHKMREIRQSGSEGGAKRTFVPTPIIAWAARLLLGPGICPPKVLSAEGAIGKSRR